MSKKTPSAYARAGVNIDAKMEALRRAGRLIRSTATAGVAGEWGSFGGLFHSPGGGDLLVSSIDGVGTKILVAQRAGRHDTVGQDLVNHCVNDILVQGAEPLFFLDYVGTSRIDAGVFAALLAGLSKACRANGCALLGGETAEMPGVYPEGAYDLVGVIVGRVPRAEVVTGAGIRPGDALIGLPSSGLHTNGYSLAREIVFVQAGLDVDDRLPGTRRTVADALLAIHRSYLEPVRALRRRVTVRGMAHITGGGFPDNLPRVLPRGCRAVIDRASWKVPPLFRFLEEEGRVDREEMYRVFNMGIGYVIAVRPEDAEAATAALREAGERPAIVGRVVKGAAGVDLEN